MRDFTHIPRCADVGEQDFEAATTDLASFQSLMSRLAQLATPGNGAVKVVLACARVVKNLPPWLEGALRVKLTVNGAATHVEVQTEKDGFVEALLPSLAFNVPLAEFSLIADKTPHLLAPLCVVWSTPTKLTLTGDTGREGTITGALAAHVGLVKKDTK